LVVRAAAHGHEAATAVYFAGLLGLFGIGAAYHLLPVSAAVRSRLRRLDHSWIYVFIAGTYTPVCAVVLRGWLGWGVLAAAWLGAAVGVATKLVRFDRFHGAGGAMYIVLGWLAVVAAPELFHRLGTVDLILLAAGGVVYTLGSMVLARHTPDPWPERFGYHEVWHAMVVAAVSLHYVVLWHILGR
jgi:hemolysin III